MKKIILLILPILFFVGKVEAKPAVCGLHSQLTNIADAATYSVKIVHE